MDCQDEIQVQAFWFASFLKILSFCKVYSKSIRTKITDLQTKTSVLFFASFHA